MPNPLAKNAGRPSAHMGSSKLIEFTPGALVQPAPLSAVPAFGIVEWHRHPDGRYEPKLLTGDQWIQLSRHPAEQLNIPVSRNTLLRLGRGGFIRVRRPTPDSIQIHLGSLIEHCEAVEEPDFWTAANLKKFKEAL